jgi:hypothetical protein
MKNRARIIEIKREAVMEAYQGLPAVARMEVDYVAATLDTRIEERNPRIKFSHTMALELLGTVGMLICQRLAQ